LIGVIAILSPQKQQKQQQQQPNQIHYDEDLLIDYAFMIAGRRGGRVGRKF